MASGNNGHEKQPPKNLQDVLKLAIEAMPQGISLQNDPVQAMPSENHEFLREALASMSVDVVKELKNVIAVLKKCFSDEDCKSEDYNPCFDAIKDCIIDIDTANAFYKIGGLALMAEGLTSQVAEIRWSSADLIAEMTQNNPFCQSKAVDDFNLLGPLISLIMGDPEWKVVEKALYATSCMIRNYPTGIEKFTKAGGFTALQRVLEDQHAHQRSTVKAAFLLGVLVSEKPNLIDEYVNAGTVTALVTAAQELSSTPVGLWSGGLIIYETIKHLASSSESARQQFVDAASPKFAATLDINIKELKDSNSSDDQMEIQLMNSLKDMLSNSSRNV